MAYRKDSDLEFLRSMSSADLDTLVVTLTGKDNLNATENLSQQKGFKTHHPNHIKYVDEIMEELPRFGGNTFVNYLIRFGKGVLYKEILCDVCDKAKVKYNKNSSVENIENELLSAIMKKAVDKMDDKTLKDIAKDAKISTAKGFSKQAAVVAMQTAIKAGGVQSYQLALIVANAVAKQILGRGVSVVASASLSRILGAFTGPIGWAITGLWTAIDIAGPAYRITMPAVIQVAFLRKKLNNTITIFLTGETGVGKDTILHILQDAKFKEAYQDTRKLEKETIDTDNGRFEIINTSGADDHDDENNDARRDLKSGTKYSYVFKVDDFLADEKVKKRVQMDLQNAKEQCKRESYNLKIIGTHKDKCEVGEREIQALIKELSENGKFDCEIWDLTKAKKDGTQIQRELVEFIKK